MTYRDAQRAAFDLGFVLSRDHGSDEYRLAPHMRDAKKAELLAYYSDDLDDVMGTLDDMARRARKAA